FQTITPISIGTRFKLEVQNTTECYIYIFGQETDGSSYVLFPYLKPGETVSKHAPYCGITGYRLFPKAQSLEADNIGNKDYIAIVTSKKELNYQLLNEAINNSAQPGFAAKVNDALKSSLVSPSESAAADGRIYFKANASAGQAVATIVAFDKK